MAHVSHQKEPFQILSLHNYLDKYFTPAWCDATLLLCSFISLSALAQGHILMLAVNEANNGNLSPDPTNIRSLRPSFRRRSDDSARWK